MLANTSDKMTNVITSLLTVDISVTIIKFFFQPKDGIRDFHVTGVQTCALPIFGLPSEMLDEQCANALGVRRRRRGGHGNSAVGSAAACSTTWSSRARSRSSS